MDLNWIADPTADSVLDLLVRDEPPTQEERDAAARGHRARVQRKLADLVGVLSDAKWDQHTTGVALVRLLAKLVGESATCPAGDTSGLQEFVAETFDGKTNAFRPHRVSQFVKARHGVGITNHTVKKMLGLLADAGRGGAAGGDRPAGASDPAGSSSRVRSSRSAARSQAAAGGMRRPRSAKSDAKRSDGIDAYRNGPSNREQPSVRAQLPGVHEQTLTTSTVRLPRRPVRLPRLCRAVRSGRR